MSDKPPYFDDRSSLFETFARHVNAGKIATFERYGFDAVMGKRKEARFGDAYSEREWYNCHCNGGVFNLGHRNEAIVEAVREALKTLDIGNHHLPSPYRAELARRLSSTTGDHLSGVVFGVSGGESIDLALKLARGVTGRQGIVSACGGYHGHTGLALASGDPAYREPFGPNLPGFRQVEFGSIEALDEAVDGDTAAVILEPIPATLGMPLPPKGYLEAVDETCHRRGAKFIVDEVQSGLGRTGRMWCWQHHDIEPDMLVTGKGLSGALYPITATLMDEEIHAFFDDHPFIHISTFGGAEPGCVAALKVLDIIESDGFLERVEEAGARFEEGFSGASFEVRRRGLMMGLKLGSEQAGMMAAKLLFDAGVFAVYANNDTSVLQFLPPLVIGDDEIDSIIDIVRENLG